MDLMYSIRLPERIRDHFQVKQWGGRADSIIFDAVGHSGRGFRGGSGAVQRDEVFAGSWGEWSNGG